MLHEQAAVEKEARTELEHAQWLLMKAKAHLMKYEGLTSTIPTGLPAAQQELKQLAHYLEQSEAICRQEQANELLYELLQKKLEVYHFLHKPDTLIEPILEEALALEQQITFEPLQDLYFTAQQRDSLLKMGADSLQFFNFYVQKMKKGAKISYWATPGRMATFGQAQLFFLLNLQYQFEGKQEAAVEALKAAFDLYRMSHEEVHLLNVYFFISGHLKAKGRFSEAIPYGEAYLALAGRHEDLSPDYLLALASLADTYQHLSEHEKALSLYEEVQRTSRQLPKGVANPERAAMGLVLVANGYIRLRMLPRAIQTFEQARSLLEDSHYQQLLLQQKEGEYLQALYSSAVYLGLSQAYTLNGELEKALEHAFHLFDMADKVGEFAEELNQLLPSGQQLPGDAGKLIRLGMGGIKVIAHVSIAAVYAKAKETKSALYHIEKAVEQFGSMNMTKDYAAVLQNKATILVDLNRLDEALTALNELERISQESELFSNLPFVYLNKAFLYEQQGHAEEEIYYLKAARKSSLEVNDQVRYARSCYELGKYYNRHSLPDTAKKYYLEALGSEALEKTSDILGWTYARMGQLLMAEGNSRQALGYFQRAIDVANSLTYGGEGKAPKGALSLQIISQDYYTGYEGAIGAYLALDSAEKAYTLCREAKGRAMKHRLSKRLADAGAIPQPLARQRDSLNRHLALLNIRLEDKSAPPQLRQSLNEEIKLTVRKLQTLDEHIFQAYQEKNGQGLPQQNRSLADIQARLKTGEILLEYFTGRDQAFAFLVQPHQFRVVALGDARAIRQTAKGFREQFVMRMQENKGRDFEAFHRYAKPLYDQLIAPLELPETGSLIIIPDGILHQIPFEMLVADEEMQKAYSDYHYLVEDYAIMYYPHSDIWRSRQTQGSGTNPPKKMLLGVGNPLFKGAYDSSEVKYDADGYIRLRTLNRNRSFEPLPYSQVELENIVQLYGKKKCEVFFQAQATEEVLKTLNASGKLADYRYIHIATHSWIDPENPALSAIAFTQDRNLTEDGLLQWHEFLGLRFNADLLVLSACETNIGKIIRGEGAMSFSQALLGAGARNMILSLWAVNDYTTAEFFQDYYAYLKASDGREIYGALRKCQLDRINSKSEYANPYYWAGFILMGNYFDQ